LAAGQSDLYRWHSENFRSVATGFERICALLEAALGEKHEQAAAESLTRVATFLLSAKIESRFYKVLHEPPVPDEFRLLVNAPPPHNPSLMEKWRRTVEIAFCEYHQTTGPFQASTAPPLAKQQHDSHMAGLARLEPIIGLRNKVAHGQWRVALNGRGTDRNRDSTEKLSAENLMSLRLKDRLAASVGNAVNDLIVSRKTHDRDLTRHAAETQNAIRELETRSWDRYLAALTKRAAIKRSHAQAVRTELKHFRAAA
jgi:hypothetical protein